MDILIVGAGIAGSALACALRDSGLKIALIDKSDQPLDTARGDHLQPFSCDILERWGVLDDFFAAGAEKRAGATWFTNQGEEILRSSVVHLDIPHPYFAFINHEKIASIMMDAALQTDDISCLRPVRNWWPDESAHSSHCIRVGLPGGTEVRIRCKMIVGADGRQSRVRQTYGLPFASHRYERSIAVFFAAEQIENQDRFLKVYLGDDVTTSVIPRTGQNCKIGVPVSMDEARSWRAIRDGDLANRLLEICPMLRISEVVFADVYAPVFLQAESWVNDSVVLIGDACHAMHPARSQGMNISIRCIDTLADILGNAGAPLAGSVVTKALAAYEDAMKTPVDALLHDNHQWGLQMDRADAGANQSLQAKLESIQSSPAALEAYSMQSAGYGDLV